MIFVGSIMVFLLYYANRRQGGALFRYCLLQRNGFQNLQKTIIGYGYQYSVKQHLLLCMMALSLVILSGVCFHLQSTSIMLLGVGAILVLPLLILWTASHVYEEHRFNDLTNFLQHFIALFKLNPKIYQTLHECEGLVQPDLKIILQEIQKQLENGEPLEHAFMPLLSYCPHFIVHNLITITTTVETHGSFYYQEGLDFIQDDIDDWIEDIYLFKKQQLQAKNRMIILCGFAGFIALVSKQMLGQIDFQIDGSVYQLSMTLFFMCIGITIVMAHLILQESWIDKEEFICRN